MKVTAFFSGLLAVEAVHPSWQAYKEQYGLEFSGPEDSQREATYAANLVFIDASNGKQTSYRLGVNKFAYLNTTEFVQTYTGEHSKEVDVVDNLPIFARGAADGDALADQVDWSDDHSVVPAVEDQGQCGSCWAFAAAGETEMIYALEFGTLYNLAKQQLVDCATDAWDFPGEGGCQGGLSGLVWQAGAYYPGHGACLTSDYPYTATDGTCHSCTPVIPAGAIVGLGAVPRGIQDLKAALVQRPMKVSVAAEAWSLYESGVFVAPECYSGTSHAVIAVGYNGDSYFKIRNSWGSNWGMDGYINLAQESSCSTGSSSIFYRPPYYPQFGTLALV